MAQQYILDRYRVIEKAGSGGYGSVYHAFDTHLKRDVAIKCIELSEADVARARILATEERLRDELGGSESAQGQEPSFAEDLLAGAFDEDDFPEDPAFLDARDGLPAQRIGVIGAAAETAIMPDSRANREDPFDHIPGLKEARMVAQLSDATIVAVHECVVEDTTAYIIMEYVEGKTLAQIMRESEGEGEGALSLDAVAAVVSSVAQALTAAHECGVLHLDIKPDNVLVNAKGQVKVTDFGLATLADANGRATTGGGTIGYMPLEQMRLEPLDARTDQWALGALTYELLTGENPFRTESLKEAQRLIEDSELVLPSLCWDELSPAADDIVFTAMDLEPDARFASVSEFAKTLMPYLGDAKAGAKELARLVKGIVVEKPAPEAPQPEQPAIPVIDRMGPRGLAIALRLVAAAGAALTCAIGLANVHLTEGSTLGLATDMMPAFAALVAAGAILALIKPHLGALASFIVLGVGLVSSGAYLLGILLLVVCACWWYFIGREGDAMAASSLLVPLFGSVGMAAVAPVTAGALLSVGRATATAAFSAFLALVCASFATGDVMGWNALAGLAFSAGDIQASFLGIVAEPRTWCVLLSWIAAAAALSFFCLRGTKAFDIAGSVVSAAILLFGVLSGFGLDLFGSTWQPGLSDFAGAILPGILGIALAASGVTDRVRWEAKDWRAYLDGPQTID